MTRHSRAQPAPSPSEHEHCEHCPEETPATLTQDQQPACMNCQHEQCDRCDTISPPQDHPESVDHGHEHSERGTGVPLPQTCGCGEHECYENRNEQEALPRRQTPVDCPERSELWSGWYYERGPSLRICIACQRYKLFSFTPYNLAYFDHGQDVCWRCGDPLRTLGEDEAADTKEWLFYDFPARTVRGQQVVDHSGEKTPELAKEETGERSGPPRLMQARLRAKVLREKKLDLSREKDAEPALDNNEECFCEIRISFGKVTPDTGEEVA